MTTRTKAHFIQLLAKVNDKIEVLGNYVSSITKIKTKCNVCKHIWHAYPHNMLQGIGCPKCGTSRQAKKISFTTAEFKAKLSAINKDVIIVGEYVTSKIKIDAKCAICENGWESTPSNLLKGCGCPICGRKKNRSKPKPIMNECKICNNKWESDLGSECQKCKAEDEDTLSLLAELEIL